MIQSDLFADAPPVNVCGTCVVRNALNEAVEYGDCSRTNAKQHRDAPACDQWFGLQQFHAPLYGRRA